MYTSLNNARGAQVQVPGLESHAASMLTHQSKGSAGPLRLQRDVCTGHRLAPHCSGLYFWDE
jgi:hypothetical protein